jgi:hypothetical protein
MYYFFNTLAHSGSLHFMSKKRQIVNEQTKSETMKLKIFIFPEDL